MGYEKQVTSETTPRYAKLVQRLKPFRLRVVQDPPSEPNGPAHFILTDDLTNIAIWRTRGLHALLAVVEVLEHLRKRGAR